nr:hypothetical protein [Tanacetum cinerariifolium]
MNDVHNIWIESRNELFNTMKSLCEMILQREQAANLSNHTPEPSQRFNSICYGDDDDEGSRGEDLRTIPEKESNEFIKSSVEDLVPIPKESEDTSDSDKECDFPFCDNFVIFSNPLFDANDDFTSSNKGIPEEKVKIYSNPFFEFDDEYISSDDECFDPGGDIDKMDADISTDIEDGYHDSEGDIIYFKSLIINDTIPNLHPERFSGGLNGGGLNMVIGRCSDDCAGGLVVVGMQCGGGCVLKRIVVFHQGS